MKGRKHPTGIPGCPKTGIKLRKGLIAIIAVIAVIVLLFVDYNIYRYPVRQHAAPASGSAFSEGYDLTGEKGHGQSEQEGVAEQGEAVQGAMAKGEAVQGTAAQGEAAQGAAMQGMTSQETEAGETVPDSFRFNWITARRTVLCLFPTRTARRKSTRMWNTM